ncbi:PAS domain-containing protein [Novosphingobium pokkalii]|uniref:PAS domain-containing protein n=1 Tax=Novosphingobium pokkalii TaxID=1770194 RepID=UPI00363C5EBE
MTDQTPIPPSARRNAQDSAALDRIATMEAMLLMCELTAEGVLVSVNDNLAQLLGTTPDALVGQRFANLCHDGVQDPSAAPGFWQRVADGHNQVMAIRLAAPEGAPVWVRLSFGRMEGRRACPRACWPWASTSAATGSPGLTPWPSWMRWTTPSLWWNSTWMARCWPPTKTISS